MLTWRPCLPHTHTPLSTDTLVIKPPPPLDIASLTGESARSGGGNSTDAEAGGGAASDDRTGPLRRKQSGKKRFVKYATISAHGRRNVSTDPHMVSGNEKFA